MSSTHRTTARAGSNQPRRDVDARTSQRISATLDRLVSDLERAVELQNLDRRVMSQVVLLDARDMLSNLRDLVRPNGLPGRAAWLEARAQLAEWTVAAGAFATEDVTGDCLAAARRLRRTWRGGQDRDRLVASA